MQQQLLENRRITSLFNSSVGLCRRIAIFHNYYSFSKIVSGVIILSLSASYHCGWDNGNSWIAIVVLESIIEFILYISLAKEFKKHIVLLKVAEELHQVIYAENIVTVDNADIANFLANPLDDPTADYSKDEEERKKSLLANQIIWEVTKLNAVLKYAKHSVFFINQGLLIWGICIVVKRLWVDGDPCSNVIEVYLSAFLFFTFFQYLEVYILIVIILICLPFFLMFLLYLKIKQSKKKIDSQKIINDIKQQNLIKYSPNVIQGDPECKICMQTYQIDEKLVKLPCHETHHFHDYCFATWFQLNLSCPVCRHNYGQVDEGINLQPQQ